MGFPKSWIFLGNIAPTSKITYWTIIPPGGSILSEFFVLTQRDKYVQYANTMQPTILIVTIQGSKRLLESLTQHENVAACGELLVGQ